MPTTSRPTTDPTPKPTPDPVTIHVIGNYDPQTNHTPPVVQSGSYGNSKGMGMDNIIDFMVENLVFLAVAGGLFTLCVMISLVKYIQIISFPIIFSMENIL